MSFIPALDAQTQSSGSEQGNPGSHHPGRTLTLSLVAIACAAIIPALMIIARSRSTSADGQNTPLNFRESIVTTETRVRELGIVLLEISHPDGITVVPAEAILREQSGTFVVVENYDRKHCFLLASVVVAPDGEGRARITGGLFPGDKIVVKGAARLRAEPDVIPKRPETNCS